MILEKMRSKIPEFPVFVKRKKYQTNVNVYVWLNIIKNEFQPSQK